MRRSSVVLLAGSVVYALLVGAAGVTFDATPLVVGAVVVTAAILGRAGHLAATGLLLMGWGAAVLLVRHGPLPEEREAAAFLVGAGVGLLSARLAGRIRPGRASGDGSAALVVGGLAFYFAFDAGWLYDWPLWTATLVVWAAWETLRSRGSGAPAT